MSYCLCTGAVLECSFGRLPGAFNALSASGVLAGGRPAGSVSNALPLLNLPTFGLCSSMSNPAVISATAAAMGTPTPAPCMPMPAGQWSGAVSDVRIGGQPALTEKSELMCAWGGRIAVKTAGQTSVRLGK